jgi:PAS domain S-box-containing protein
MEQLIHILHLEDALADTELVQARLESAGLNCLITRVQTRDEFDEALRHGGYDLILGDFRLPGYDGMSALRLTQELCPDIPFIFVSGVMGEDAAIEGLTKGATDYVLKQKLSRLVPAVTRALHEAENRRERRRVEEALRMSEARLAGIIESAMDAIISIDTEQRIVLFNAAAEEMFGCAASDVMGQTPGRFIPAHFQQAHRERIRAFAHTGQTKRTMGDPSLMVGLRANGEEFPIEASISQIEVAGVKLYTVILRDITQRKRMEERLQISHKLLMLINRHWKIPPLLNEFVAELKHLTGCTAIGIRLLDEAGHIPYEAYDGFSQEFYQSENSLSIHSDRCLCINVITGQVDPQLPFYTAGGSFYTNSATHFLATVTEEEKGPTRNVCFRFGYETVVLVPIRVKEQVLGLIHLADTRENVISSEMISTLEAIALQLGTNLLRIQAEEALQHYADRLQALSRRLVEVQEAERRHIARELHDEVGQALTGLKLLLEVVLRLPAETVPSRLDEALRLVDELMNLVHDLSLDLRPGILDDLGLLPALLWLIERYTARTGVHVFFEQQHLKQRFPPQVETTAYRIVQEALTNIARHAGVDEAAVRLRADQSTLYLLVQDAGPGFDLPAVLARGQTVGLANMQERAALLGGWVKIDSGSGSGTQVSAALPLKFDKEAK